MNAAIADVITAIEKASRGAEVRQKMADALTELNKNALPAVTAEDAGKVLGVDEDGNWILADPGGGGDYEDLIEITSAAAPWKTTYTDQLRTYADVARGIRLVSTVNIAADAFANFGRLRWAELPGVQSIGARAFKNCRNLKELDAPLVATLGEQTFLASGLEAVSLPLVTELPRQALYDCASLRSAYLPRVVTVGDQALATGLDSIDLPAAESLGYFAFGGCGIRSVSFSNLKTAGQRAFAECYRLETVELPLAEAISEYCFIRCTALKSVTLPSAKSIDSYAFTGCSQLESLTIGAASVCTLTDNNMMMFSGTPSSLKIYVPPELVNSYKTAAGWSNYEGKIYPIA